MHIHQLKELDFDEALELLETRLAETRAAIDAAQKKIDDGDYDGDRTTIETRMASLQTDRAALEARMEKLRQQKASELAGETDNLLTEMLELFDRIGERLDNLFS